MNLCECGCGETVKKRFVKGHILNVINADGRNRTSLPGPTNHLWRGGTSTNGVGYITLRIPDHPNANSAGQVLEHVLIASRAMGKPVPLGVEVHHVDENPGNNSNANLVVCNDHGYHMLLQRRTKALRECGHAEYMKCEHCHQYDSPQNLRQSRTRAYRAYHPACNARAGRQFRQRSKS